MKWISDDKLDHLRTLVANPDFSSTKYTFVKELARGGMGTVYLAEDTELDRHVAIKVLNTPDVTDDLRDRILRHTTAAFAEDPLRVLRGMQFAARFDMRLATETAALCRQLLPEAPTLAIERVWAGSTRSGARLAC